MMITKKALSRRTVLKALGATVPLPLLDAMVPALTALRHTAAAPALRFGAVYVPNGVIPGQWFPATDGSAFEWSPTLQPHSAIACSSSAASTASRRRRRANANTTITRTRARAS